MIKSLFIEILNFILPNSCICCQASTDAEEQYLCHKCKEKLELYRDKHPWQQDRISDGTIDNSISAFWFREGMPIQPLLHAMKYSKMKGIGVMLGRELGKIISAGENERFNCIIPVPLHKAKYRERTYNQSEYIAGGISDILKAEVINDGVIRTRFTGTQTRLNKAEREENVSGAFDINPKYAESIRGKNIILVDDVITTGATILECASALKKASAGKVWVCSAAYAELKLNVV
ncbi:MAG: phosphoribosyltransferase family protein [Ignavibacteria bacterium]